MTAAYKQKIDLMRRQMEIRGFYHNFKNLLMLDNWTALPSKGQAHRQKQAAFLAGEMQKHQTSEVIQDLVAYFKEIAMFSAKAQAVWKEAHEKSDFSLFKPYLEKIFRMNREIADLIKLPGHPLNSLAAQYEPGIDVKQVEALFADLRDGIVMLLKKVKDSSETVNNNFLFEKFDKTAVFDFTRHVVEKMGYDPDAGGYGEVLHPFCAILGPKDARMTSNYNSFPLGFWGGIHEAGHGMYAVNSDVSMMDTGLYGGIAGSVHESQARFYENFLGKSRELLSFFYPEVQKRFPLFEGVPFEDFYKGVNKVEPTFIRIRADEMTYSLHPIIRFEIEKEILEDKIKIDELPDVWNAKYKEYLGIEPTNAREGILQDVHWSLGMLGYFQSYSLGNLYGGQFWHQMKQDVPDAFDESAIGNFEPVNTWLIEKIHKHGSLYTPDELIRKVTGQRLSARYFLDYLEEKYSKIYGF
jgi:carboxypeptidase Taq